MTDYRTEGSPGVVTHTEQPWFQPMTVVDLKESAARVDQSYKNFVLLNVNNHCVRMAVMQGEFRWHHHPHSDECFLVLEGELEIEIKGGETFRLTPGQAFTVPAGIIHRTRARARTVNLCFEDCNAYTDAVFNDGDESGS